MERMRPELLRSYKQQALGIVSEYEREEGIPLTVEVGYSRARKRAPVEQAR